MIDATSAEAERQALEIQAMAMSLHRQGVDSERIYRVLMQGDYTIGNDIIYMIVTLVITENTGIQTIEISESNIPKIVALAKQMWDSGQDMYEILDVTGHSDLALRAIASATGVDMRRADGTKPTKVKGVVDLWQTLQ